MSWHRKLPNQAACGSCCGIKEKLQTLWDRTINSILRINQVEPDDQGNIRIRSDSEALTVTEGTNEIVLDLDTSELPAASVVSVNGETGAVQLSGDDIPSLYNGTVNSNIYGLWSTKAQRSDLNTEITNRQNADTALQNNINTLQASIPQEAADAVAADPTVQSFAAAATAIPDKVDKRTGAGLRAYTHTGSTQDDTPVIDGTTGTTIPIRNSNGRLQAADPAAGATDKTLTTANWISQTGSGRPNNLIHNQGNEEKNGDLTLHNMLMLDYANYANRCLNAKSLNFDLDAIPTAQWDIFLGRCIDKNNNEVERDYVRKGNNYILAEKWFTFKDDDGNIYHPSISIFFRTDTKLATFSVFGIEIARRQY